jgi:hypothetical protein
MTIRREPHLHAVPDNAAAADLAELRAQFPAFHIYREARPAGRARYVAQRIRDRAHPHTVVTTDPGELREELSRNGPAPILALSAPPPATCAREESLPGRSRRSCSPSHQCCRPAETVLVFGPVPSGPLPPAG